MFRQEITSSLVTTVAAVLIVIAPAAAEEQADTPETLKVAIGKVVVGLRARLPVRQFAVRGQIPETNITYALDFEVEQETGRISVFSYRLADKTFQMDVSDMQDLERVDLGSLEFWTRPLSSFEYAEDLYVVLKFHYGDEPLHCLPPYPEYDLRNYATFNVDYSGNVQFWTETYNEDCMTEQTARHRK